MSSTSSAAGVGEQFQALYRRLSRHQANALLNDCIYELSAAWKFLTALRVDLPILVVLHGFSGVPLAFARHLCRVDIWGFNQNETALFRELAQFKNLSNYRVCRDVHELKGPYGLILWLPTRSAVDQRHEDDWLIQALTHLHPEGELWLTHCHKPDWSNPLSRLRRLMRRLRSREHEALPATIRLLTLAEPIPHQSLLETLTAKIAAHSKEGTRVQQRSHLGIMPHWSAPTLIAPLPSFPQPRGKSAEHKPFLRTLEQKKLLETYHALAHFGASAFSPFMSRLLRELARHEPGSEFQLNHYRVLAGGKVQIDARWKKRRSEQSLFIKLPLVPFAEARLRKQSETLHYLHRHERLRRFEVAGMAPPKIFPQILAQGEFEKQAYFLESRVKGAPLSRLYMPNEAFRQVCDRLFAFWHEVQTRCGATVAIDQNKFDRIFGRPLQQVRQWALLPHSADAVLQRLENFFAEHWLGQRVFLSPVHGDFSTKNILAHPKTFEVSGIIDWDITTRESFPLLDVLHFFVRLDPGSFREAPPKIAMRLIATDSPALHWTYMQNALTRFGYEKKVLPAMVAYYWVQRLQVYLDSPKYLDTQFMQRHIYDILDFFAETILKK
ncbi:MAG: hypothetical protein ALAOOOJD_00913 [bacterium]|nr:hypothetical protein [bacterium]